MNVKKQLHDGKIAVRKLWKDEYQILYYKNAEYRAQYKNTRKDKIIRDDQISERKVQKLSRTYNFTVLSSETHK